MSLWKIALRSIQQRGLASFLTALSMALGVTLVVAVLVISGVVERAFQENAGMGYHLILGAKGGKLQLVLNTVYHLSSPVENIPYSFYQEFLPAARRRDGHSGRYAPYTARAIPVCMGDYFEGFRVIGTTPEFFDARPDGQPYEFSQGENFKADDFWGAVVGSVVARQLGMKLGSPVNPTHGAEDGHVHEEHFEVRGILAPTGTPADRGVYVNMEGFYLMEGHAKEHAAGAEDAHHDHAAHHHAEHQEADGHAPHGEASHAHDGEGTNAHDDGHEDHDQAAAGHDGHGHDRAGHDHHQHGHDGHEHGHAGHHHAPLPENQREVTAILLRLKEDLYAPGMRNTINEGPVAQAVAPISEITSLFNVIVRPIQVILLLLTVLIVVVSAISILVSMYNSMSERRREIAVMRALGAGRSTIMLIVLLESILLALAGGACGWLLGHGLIGALSPWIEGQTGVTLGFLRFVPLQEVVLIPALIVLATLVGYLPALTAYRTDVAKALTASP